MPKATNILELDLTKEYTYADYLLWQFQDRVELIRGFIVKMSPAPNRFHQTISSNLNAYLHHYFKNKSCSFYTAPFDVRLPIISKKSGSTVVQPDLCVICDKNKLDEQGCNGAPDLVIEILSPQNSKHDLDIKFNLYEESGVKEYWIIHPVDKTVWVYTLQNNKYIGLKPFTQGNSIDSPLFPEMRILVNEVFFEN